MDSKDLQNIMEELTSRGFFRKYEAHCLSENKDEAKRTLQDMIENDRLLFEKSIYTILPDETSRGYSVTKYVISRSDLIQLLQEGDM